MTKRLTTGANMASTAEKPPKRKPPAGPPRRFSQISLMRWMSAAAAAERLRPGWRATISTGNSSRRAAKILRPACYRLEFNINRSMGK